MNHVSDYKNHECKAKIRSQDGQEIATGIALLGGAHIVGMFAPDHSNSIAMLDTLAGQKVVVEIGSHRHEVLGWHHCNCRLRIGYESGVFGDHYHFQSED